MAAKRPASQSAGVTPTPDDSGEAASAAAVSDPTPAAPDSVPAAAAADPAVAETPVAAETPAQPTAPAQQVVYVEAPKPFVPKSNRVFGVLIALLSTIIFAAVSALETIFA